MQWCPAGLEPATCVSQVRCPTNSTTGSIRLPMKKCSYLHRHSADGATVCCSLSPIVSIQNTVAQIQNSCHSAIYLETHQPANLTYFPPTVVHNRRRFPEIKLGNCLHNPDHRQTDIDSDCVRYGLGGYAPKMLLSPHR